MTYGRSVVESKIVPDGRESADGRKRNGEEESKRVKEKERERKRHSQGREKTKGAKAIHTGVTGYHIGQVEISEPPFASSLVSTARIRNESNGFDALRDHE